MRAGLFGGTFNPIHNGHLMVAESVLQRFSLDRLYFIPCRTPPHKTPEYLAPAVDRTQMIRLALPKDMRYCLSDIELRRSGPSYTIDTVDHFKAQVICGASLYLIMGMDAFLEIHTWKSYQRLLESIQPVVVTRKLNGQIKNSDEIKQLDRYIRSQLSPDYRYCKENTRWQRRLCKHIHLLLTMPVNVSSSQVRQHRKEGKAITSLVPPAVNAYIEQKEIYR